MKKTMLIENFIIYKYDNVFYTKEELEQMGFVYISGREDFTSLKEKSINYEITTKYSLGESFYSIEDYLNLSEKHLIGQFLYDFGDHGLILGVEKYYGIRYKNQGKVKIIKLFNSEIECSDAYLKIETEIESKFEKLSHCANDIHNNQSIEMLNQEKEKETRQKVLNLINKKL